MIFTKLTNGFNFKVKHSFVMVVELHTYIDHVLKFDIKCFIGFEFEKMCQN